VARLARFIVSLTPYGLFAIAAVTAGTLDLDQAAQIQIYLACSLTVSLLLALWVLPGLVAAVTPVPHGALLGQSRSTLFMAFATGSLLVVLPMLVDRARELVREHADLAPQDERLPDLIVPAAFNFPNAGKLLSLGFIVFAAWFTGASIPPSQYPALGAAGVLSLFGSTNVAVPFLLDLFRVPADTFQLFLATGVVSARFGTLLAAMHTLAIAIIGTCAVAGAVRLDVRKLLRFGAITLVIATAALGGTRLVVGRLVSQPYAKDKVLAGMHALRNRGEAHVYRTATTPLAPVTGSVLDRVYSRKMLRVGYFDNSLPYAFTNAAGDLVGFDVEMALQLARDLNVGLELVPANRRLFDEGLDPSECDLVMSGAAVTADRAVRVLFSTPYVDETLAFIVLDHRRGEFSSWDDIRSARSLRLGVPRALYYQNKIRAELPAAEVVTFDGPDEMLQPRQPALDALVLTAERGSAYTLLHPEYSVVVPKPRPLKVPLAYVIAGRDQALATVIDTWIDLKRKDGTIDDLFAHWILGRDATPRRPRWSIMDDVLHWKT
jgi:ABC-type amino acid transport substrate-binding protein